MNKKLLELLDSINEKKTLIKGLIESGKIDEAKTAKTELQEMQDKFDILKDIEDTTPSPKNLNPIKTPENDSIAKFAAAARAGFSNVMSEGSKKDGGYTVPEDIETRVRQYRDAEFNLGQLVTTENVQTETGSRTYQKKSKMTGFSQVGESGKIGAVGTPEFERITYSIKKFAGYCPVTNELLDDTDENIVTLITRWLAGQSRVTRNKLILNALAAGKTAELSEAPTYTTIKGLDGLTRAVTVTLGAAYKATAKIITNDYGLQELCELKDANGRPLLQPNPVEPTRMQVCAGPVIIPVEVIPASEFPNVEDGGKVYAPVIIGDLKEAVTLFDRRKLSIMASDTAAVTGLYAYEEDLTLFRAIEREDVQVVDSDAYVLGHFSRDLTAPVEG